LTALTLLLADQTAFIQPDFDAELIPLGLATVGVDVANARHGPLVLAPRRLLWCTAGRIACPAVFLTLISVLEIAHHVGTKSLRISVLEIAQHVGSRNPRISVIEIAQHVGSENLRISVIEIAQHVGSENLRVSKLEITHDVGRSERVNTSPFVTTDAHTGQNSQPEENRSSKIAHE